MKVGNHALTGTLFLPTLGFAFCGLVLSYWLSKRKHNPANHGSANDSATEKSTSTTSEVTPIENGKPKVVKEKKAHKCGCGSDKSKLDVKPSTINIMYGTLTGKSKVNFMKIPLAIFFGSYQLFYPPFRNLQSLFLDT